MEGLVAAVLKQPSKDNTHWAGVVAGTFRSNDGAHGVSALTLTALEFHADRIHSGIAIRPTLAIGVLRFHGLVAQQLRQFWFHRLRP